MRFSASFKGCLLVTVMTMSHASGQEHEVQSLIARGDLSDVTYHASEALQEYLPAEKLDPKNVPLLLRIARQYSIS